MCGVWIRWVYKSKQDRPHDLRFPQLSRPPLTFSRLKISVAFDWLFCSSGELLLNSQYTLATCLSRCLLVKSPLVAVRSINHPSSPIMRRRSRYSSSNSSNNSSSSHNRPNSNSSMLLTVLRFLPVLIRMLRPPRHHSPFPALDL